MSLGPAGEAVAVGRHRGHVVVTGHVLVGSCAALLGGTGLVAGIFRSGFAAGDFLGTPMWALSLTGGAVLVLAGMLVLLFSFRDAPEPEPEVPAHVAFNSRMVVPDAAPSASAAALMRVPRPAAASAPAARLPAPAAPAQQRVAPIRPEQNALEMQIRELTRHISKAGVMLATGQLSQGGYLAYVEDLKKQRSALEAERVRAELRST